MSALPTPRLTPDEYLALDRAAERRSEYLDGVMYAMSGASFRHELIVANMVAAIHPRLRESSCRVVASNLRVQSSEEKGLYAYPDLVVVRGEPKFADGMPDTLTNPKVIIEVLSESTEDYDRGRKFVEYRKGATLAEYILVAQDRVHVEHNVRQADGSWILTETDRLDDVLEIPSIAVRLALREVYDGVTFAPAG